MRYIISSLILLFLAGQNAWSETVTIEKIPASVEEFLTMRDKLAVTPEGGAVMFVAALITYVENYDLGLQFFTIAMDQSALEKGNVYKGYKPGRNIYYHLDRFKEARRARTPWSYVSGTKPQGGYQAEAPYSFNFSTNSYSMQYDGSIKLFIDCSGADSPRPIRMKKNDKGLWKAVEFSSLFLDVVTITEEKDDL